MMIRRLLYDAHVGYSITPTSGLLTCGDTVCEEGDNFCTRFGFCARLAKEGEECLAATRVLGFCKEGLTCVDLTGNAQLSVFGFVVDEGATECQPTVVVADGEPCGDPALPNVCGETSICSGNEGDVESELLVNRVCVAEPKEGEQCVASVRGFGACGPGLECVDLSGELELNDLSIVDGGQDVSVTQCQAA